MTPSGSLAHEVEFQPSFYVHVGFDRWARKASTCDKGLISIIYNKLKQLSSKKYSSNNLIKKWRKEKKN